MGKSPRVAILLGSKNDEGHLKSTTELLDRFGIPWELKVISAHRQPEALHAYVRAADAGGTEVFIAAAGLSAALPGVVGSISQRPVIGLPIPGARWRESTPCSPWCRCRAASRSPRWGGLQRAKNAAILAAQMIALKDAQVAEKLRVYREELRAG